MKKLIRPLLIFLSGAAMAFAMPPFGLWPLLFAGFSLFYALTAGQTGWRVFLSGWLFGFGYFLVGLLWIGNALLVPGNPFKWVWPLAIAGLPVLMALFTGAGCYTAARLAPLRSWAGFFSFIACIGVAEWLRGHIFTGFPWNLYGYGWARSLSMVQSVSVIGIYGLSALTVAWAALPGFLYAIRAGRKAVSLSLLALITTLNVALMWGMNRLDNNPTVLHDDIIVRIVQPNIAQEDKWSSDKTADNLHALLRASAAEKIPGLTYALIWPETAVSDFLMQNESARDVIRDAVFGNDNGNKTYILSGVLRHALRGEDEPLYFNSLIAYDSRLTPLATFDKAHLVPFGEYIPFQHIIPLDPFVDFSGFTPGTGLQTQSASPLPPYSALVCYEILFPHAVALRQPRPEWIVNVTNDGWYGDSPGPYQHLTKAVFRAAEEGLPVIRAANTGISAAIDPYGRILQKIPYGIASYADIPLPRSHPEATPYARYGDTPFLAILGVVILGHLLLAMRKRRNLLAYPQG
ncbi:MAG: apolipoprotein N-acyltransferase [Micavibrio aeruginosavorus]|nr:apolipoprotein N-acyltransferase [Micavibrio aeruginosavorus]